MVKKLNGAWARVYALLSLWWFHWHQLMFSNVGNCWQESCRDYM